MRTINLGLAIHNHQPVGNFPWVFDEAYRKSYLPMLEALERHPGIRLCLHYSGPLIDWIMVNQPEFIDRLRSLVQRGQVEMMTGGYYEPILVSIPESDRQGQIAKMTEYLAQDLGARATGLWVAERVWEPQMPSTLHRAGAEWTVVDDTHFKSLGLRDEDLFGYYITEDQGEPVRVFGTSKHMRYIIPWKDVETVIEWLQEQATEQGDRIAVMGDDGEKFGMWPGTYEHCWVKGWMERFFTSLEDNREWLVTTHLGEYTRRYPPVGRAYLPAASYAEMMEWALPPQQTIELEALIKEMEQAGREDVLAYLKGGFWRNFIVKYDEINRMHKKMLRVHRKVQQAGGAGQEQLWMGQCNCPYWHGVFGGIYLADIRTANYRHLVQGEVEAEAILKQADRWLAWELDDYDLDGHTEVLLDGSAGNIYLDPARGGSIIEWDLRLPPYNLAASLSRRPEAYHAALLEACRARERASRQPEEGQSEIAPTKSEAGTSGEQAAAQASPQDSSGNGPASIHDGLRFRCEEVGALEYDSYLRTCLIDHFLPHGIRPEAFSSASYQELGNFVSEPYTVCLAGGQEGEVLTEGEVRADLSRDGRVAIGDDLLPVRVDKTLTMRPGQQEMKVHYSITNLSDCWLDTLFASEWNINLLGGGHNPLAYFLLPGGEEERLDEPGAWHNVGEAVLGNRGLGIELRFNAQPEAALWRMPLETVSNSEGGIERAYQATTLVFALPIRLAPGESAPLALHWQWRQL